jgi:hypothetical protein
VAEHNKGFIAIMTIIEAKLKLKSLGHKFNKCISGKGILIRKCSYCDSILTIYSTKVFREELGKSVATWRITHRDDKQVLDISQATNSNFYICKRLKALL